MSLCFCSILKPLLLNREHDFVSRWAPNPNVKPVHLFNLQTHGTCFSFKAVHTDGVGVIYPDDTVSERTGPLAVEPESGAHGDGVIGAVAVATASEESQDAPISQIRSKRSEDKKGNADDSDRESRFKLRNGREVFEEKAYLVGVARKGDTEGSFSIEESLSELEQLADTAGLSVVGSTCQSFKAVHTDGVGVIYPDDTVSERTGPLAVEPESEAHGDGVIGEVEVGTATEESQDAPSSQIRSKRSEDKKGNADDSDKESRFKLRNGREVFEEKAYLVGVARKGDTEGSFSIEESLSELEQLADTAGLSVVGSTCQKLATPNSRTYIGSGKVAEIKTAINAFGVETVIFDDELSPGQLRNLEKAFGGDVRVCDRTALILDIFNQRAATREASLQVSLAQMEYQLPRLTKMWSHLERQSGGQVKGMGEKQIEVDKRILRDQIGAIKKEIESVRKHRKQYRNRRFAIPVPVVSLVGYTNAGKSTLLNRLTGADVLAEDKLFATLDPTTRRVQNGKEFLLTDTVGFIQKLPTTLVAAFRATLEEISESSLIVHVVDISHPLAEQQIDAVDKVLAELDTTSIPKLIVWNKVDNAKDPEKIKSEAKDNADIVCISALTGEGLDDFCNAVQEKLKDMMIWVEALIPFDKLELLSTIHHVGMVEKLEYVENGAMVRAHVPLRFARLLTPMRQTCVS